MLKTISIALAGAALVAAPAASAEQNDAQTVGVTVDDLDLATDQGREELDRRIDHAAKEVCGLNDANTGSRVPNRQLRQCYRDAKRQMDRHFAEVVEEQRRGG